MNILGLLPQEISQYILSFVAPRNPKIVEIGEIRPSDFEQACVREYFHKLSTQFYPYAQISQVNKYFYQNIQPIIDVALNDAIKKLLSCKPYLPMYELFNNSSKKLLIYAKENPVQILDLSKNKRRLLSKTYFNKDIINDASSRSADYNKLFVNESIFISIFNSVAHLEIESSDLTDKQLQGISKLQNLKALNIGYNEKITDISLEKIANLNNLAYLNIERCGVTDKGVSHLFKLKKLGVLKIKGNEGVTKKGIKKFKKIESLSELYISSNLIEYELEKIFKGKKMILYFNRSSSYFEERKLVFTSKHHAVA